MQAQIAWIQILALALITCVTLCSASLYENMNNTGVY